MRHRNTPNPHTPNPDRSATRTGAFSLIELLVVLAILVVLMTITIVVTARVRESGRTAATTDTIRVLDSVLAAYLAESGEKPPAFYLTDNQQPDERVRIPIIDGRAADSLPPDADEFDRDSNPALPSLQLFLLEARRHVDTDSLLSGINESQVQSRKLDFLQDPAVNGSDTFGPTVLDAWGRPIRYVHPRFDGGYGEYFLPDGTAGPARPDLQVEWGTVRNLSTDPFRRSYRPFDPDAALDAPNPVGDADEGICQGGRPYFYSAGADGDPGTIEDNAYADKPTLPPETAQRQ